MSDFYQLLSEEMEKRNIFIKGDVQYLPGKFQRFNDSRSHNRSKDIFVMVFSDEEGASFGDWHYPDDWHTWWLRSYNTLSDSEKADREFKLMQQKQNQVALRKYAMHRADWLLNHRCTKEASFNHSYVIKKRIVPYYARQLRGYMLLPIRDISGKLQSIQYIKPSHFKQFKRDAPIKGGFMLLGEKIKDGDTVRICEGYATGCSIYEAMGEHVIISFSAYNLVEVAIAIKIKYPLVDLQICADNDETGLEKGIVASKATGAPIFYPDFSAFPHNKKYTDFNDLFCIAGIEELEKQLTILRKNHGQTKVNIVAGRN